MLEVAFVLLDTPVTWLEVLAFVLALANIGCNVAEIHWGWPLSIAASALYAWLFYVSRLYGEASVNLFFAATAIWGWWQWLHGRRPDSGDSLQIARLARRGQLLAGLSWLATWVLCSALLYLITDSDVWWADGFVTAGSIVGTVLLGRKYIENWPVWLLVNVASVALFLFKGLPLTALLYVLFLGLAVMGWTGWNKRYAQPAFPGETT